MNPAQTDQVLAAEYGLLGGLMRSPETIHDTRITMDDFYIGDHRLIFGAIRDMVAAKEWVDPISVAEKMNNAAMTDLLVRIAEQGVSAGSVKSYAAVVMRHSEQRRVLAIATGLAEGARKGEPDIADAIKRLMALERVDGSSDHDISEVLRSAIEEIEAAYANHGALQGVSSGLRDIDNKLGGFHPSDLIVVGARPSIGKTAFAINLMIAAGVPVGMISAEQPATQIGQRIIAIRGMINASRMRNGQLQDEDWGKLSRAVGGLKSGTIRIYDKSAPSIAEVSAKARQWSRDYGIKALYVDYIQRLKANKTDIPRHEQVAEVVMGLKELARDLNIPVIALSQINRQVEQGTNKRPSMGQLKDSGAIEQEADVIMLLYRDEVYHDDSPRKGILDVAIEKNRHGQIGAVAVAWLGECMKTSDLEHGHD